MITSAIHTTLLISNDHTLHAAYRDFQGNVRTVAANGRVRQLTHYYPYGLPWAETKSPSHSLRKYSSKEFYTRSGYDTYNFEARQYHPAVPRFTTPDPLAEVNPGTLPYTYCSANPIARIDPTGLSDYYGLNGKHLHHKDDDDQTAYLLIAKNYKNVTHEKLIENGDFIPLPSQELIQKLDKMFELTESDNKERIVLVGTQGTVTNIHEGESDEVSNMNATSELDQSKSEKVLYDIHTHPLPEDPGPQRESSTVVSSKDDQKCTYQQGICVLLGYKVMGANSKPERRINFFKKDGDIFPREIPNNLSGGIIYDGFRTGVNKARKHFESTK